MVNTQTCSPEGSTRPGLESDIHRVAVTFRFLSMPAGFCRHLVGKTLKTVSCGIALMALLVKLMIMWTLSLTRLIEFYLNNGINLRALIPHIVLCNTDKMATVS